MTVLFLNNLNVKRGVGAAFFHISQSGKRIKQAPPMTIILVNSESILNLPMNGY